MQTTQIPRGTIGPYSDGIGTVYPGRWNLASSKSHASRAGEDGFKLARINRSGGDRRRGPVVRNFPAACPEDADALRADDRAPAGTHLRRTDRSGSPRRTAPLRGILPIRPLP